MGALKIAILLLLLFPLPARADEARCTELGSSCICSEPLDTTTYTYQATNPDESAVVINPTDTNNNQCTGQFGTGYPIAPSVSGLGSSVLARLTTPDETGMPTGNSVTKIWHWGSGEGDFWGFAVPQFGINTRRACYRQYMRLSPNYDGGTTMNCDAGKFMEMDWGNDHDFQMGSAGCNGRNCDLALGIPSVFAWGNTGNFWQCNTPNAPGGNCIPWSPTAGQTNINYSDCYGEWCRLETCVSTGSGTFTSTPNMFIEGYVVRLSDGKRTDFQRTLFGLNAPGRNLTYPAIVNGFAGQPGEHICNSPYTAHDRHLSGAYREYSYLMAAEFTTDTPGLFIGPASEVEGTITAGPGTLAFSGGAFAQTEGTGGTSNLLMTVVRTGGSTGSVGATVTFAGSGGSPATGSGTDFTSTSQSVQFVGGQVQAVVSVPITADATIESNETFTATLSAPTNGATLGAQTTAVGTIIDDDTAPPSQPVMTLSASPLTLSGQGSTSTVTASLTSAAAQNITVNVYLLNGTATWTGPTPDFSVNVGAITILSGASSGTMLVTDNSSVVSDGKTIVIAVTAVSAGATWDGDESVTITIDDSGPSVPSVTFDCASSTSAEVDHDVIACTATLSGVASDDVEVTLLIAGTATLSLDYGIDLFQITIPQGNLSAQDDINIIDDIRDEADETIILTIESATNATLGVILSDTITITDNDATPTVTLDTSDETITEAGGTHTIEALLSAISGRPVTVNLAYTGTATNAVDYIRSADQILIQEGIPTGTITITALQDAGADDAETVIADIDTVVNANESGTQTETITIADDDIAAFPNITLTASPATFSEAGGTSTLTATINPTSADTVTASVAFSGTASIQNPGADYRASDAGFSIAAGQTTDTITLTGIDDLAQESAETIIAELDVVTNAVEATPQLVTVVIHASDYPSECNSWLCTILQRTSRWWLL